MSDTLPGIAPQSVSITCSITPAAPTDRWTVEGVDFHGNIVREVYDVPRGERVVTNMREVRTIHMETVEPGEVTVGEMFAMIGADEEAELWESTHSADGREVTAEEAASVARMEAPEMVKRVVDGAVHGRSGRCL